MGIGYQELLIIFLIVLLLFGGRKIPEIARGLGKGIREFKKARDDIRDAIEMESADSDADEYTTSGPEPAPAPADKDAGQSDATGAESPPEEKPQT